MKEQKMMKSNERPYLDTLGGFYPIVAGMLSDWTNTVLSLNVLYLVITWLTSGGSYHNVVYFFIAVTIHIISIEFLTYMAKQRKESYSSSPLHVFILSPYLEKNTSEHYKSALTWVALCQLLTIVSNISLLLWLVTPGKAGYVAWTNVISPQLHHKNAHQKKKRYVKNEKNEKRSRKKNVN